jgi:hypothetical protein
VVERKAQDLSQTQFIKLREEIRKSFERVEDNAERTRELLLAVELLHLKYAPRELTHEAEPASLIDAPART